jgi:hypothetical protein
VVAGEVGCVRGIIPWTALGSDACLVELEDVELTLAPRPGAISSTLNKDQKKSGGAKTESGAESCEEGRSGLAEGSSEFSSYLGAQDGIQVIALLIEKVILSTNYNNIFDMVVPVN